MTWTFEMSSLMIFLAIGLQATIARYTHIDGGHKIISSIVVLEFLKSNNGHFPK